jgi:FKBP-type peptidyl-prolyl cis-trans isomerase
MVFSSCQKKAQMPSNKIVEEDSTSTNMIKLNKLLAEVEDKEIKSYIQKSKVQYQASPLGFWYHIDQQGTGKQINDGTDVVIEYEVGGLSGNTFYNYTQAKRIEMTINKSKYERGFNYGLTLLKEGAKASFIIPSQLGFGLLGDRNKIPPRAVLVYKVLSIKTK